MDVLLLAFVPNVFRDVIRGSPMQFLRPHFRRSTSVFRSRLCLQAAARFEGVYKKRDKSSNSHGVAIIFDSKVWPVCSFLSLPVLVRLL